MHGIEDELPTLFHHPLIPYFQNCLSTLTTLEHCSWLEANAGGLYEKVIINRAWLNPTWSSQLKGRASLWTAATAPSPDPQIETRTNWNKNTFTLRPAFRARVVCSRPGTAGAKQPELKTGQRRFCVAIWLNLTPQHAFGLTCTLAQRRHLKMCLFQPKTSRFGSRRACVCLQMEQSWFTMSCI